MPIVVDPLSLPPVEPPADPGSNLWELLYEALTFHRDTDADNDFALRTFCEAWCLPLQEVYDLVRERTDGAAWAVLFDPDRCPARSLPYLAQFVGVVITPEMSTEQVRAEINQPTGWKRGQTESIRIATRRTLKPVAGEELMVIIRPRTPAPGRHYIRTLLAQTPEPDRTEAVIEAKLPAWEVPGLDYAAIDGVNYADIRAAFPTYKALREAFPTYKALREVLPTELPEP